MSFICPQSRNFKNCFIENGQFSYALLYIHQQNGKLKFFSTIRSMHEPIIIELFLIIGKLYICIPLLGSSMEIWMYVFMLKIKVNPLPTPRTCQLLHYKFWVAGENTVFCATPAFSGEAKKLSLITEITLCRIYPCKCKHCVI